MSISTHKYFWDCMVEYTEQISVEPTLIYDAEWQFETELSR